jgi:CheY-like chemotaxis protein
VIEELQERFRDKFIETARERLTRGLAALGGEGDPAIVRHELHALAGEASMLGIDAMCTEARAGEAAARRWLETSAGEARVESGRALRNLVSHLDEFASAGSQTQADSERTTAARGKRVLVVDDSVIVAEQVCDELDAEGIETQVAAGADEAIAAVSEFAPHVIATDVRLPGVEIENLCKSFRDASDGAVQIVLISALDAAELAVILRRTGADGCVTKQSGLPAIVECIVSRLASSDM